MLLADAGHERFSVSIPIGSNGNVVVLGAVDRKGNLPLERDGEYLLRSTVAALAALAARPVLRASMEDTMIREVMIKKVNSERSEEAISINDDDLTMT